MNVSKHSNENVIKLDFSSRSSISGEKQQYKYISIIQMLYVTALLATVVLTYKMVAFGPLLEPGGVFIFPLTYFFGDVIAEVYGYKLSRQLVWNGLICEGILPKKPIIRSFGIGRNGMNFKSSSVVPDLLIKMIASFFDILPRSP